MKALKKQYLLCYFYMGKMTEVKRGDNALLQWERSKLKKLPQYSRGKLTIISEAGLKYASQYAK